MKTTYNWLKKFVEIKLPPEKLAQKLSMAGLEVESLEKKGNDYVFEIEVTSNRPDWLSVIGIAREIAALTNQKLKLPKITLPKIKSGENFFIEIKDKNDCPLYAAKIIRDVKVGPSEAWMKELLEAVGCRSVNSIVDITNYILFTYGEPLHAFDLDKLTDGKIIVRQARPVEKIIGIDGIERRLEKGTLVIADSNGPIAIAGIIGGKETEVSEKTKNILLEAAVFNPIFIRRARQKLGINTESSYRFERGVGQQTVLSASAAAAEMICQIASGKLTLAKASSPLKIKKASLDLNPENIEKILGIKIPSNQVRNILLKLGFKLKIRSKSKISVEVPYFRQDIDQEIDLIEEIARIYGYENIPTTLPIMHPDVSGPRNKDNVALVKDILIGLGLNEAITYSLVQRDILKGFVSQDNQPLEILNPLSKEQEVLRPVIIPSLLSRLAYNFNQKQEQAALFEVAKHFYGGERPKEKLALAIVLSFKNEFSILNLKGIVETLFERLGIKEYKFYQENHSPRVEVLVKNAFAGSMYIVDNILLNNFEIKNRTVLAAELDLEKILSALRLEKKFQGLPMFPGMARDISLVISEQIKVEEVLLAIKQKAGDLLSEVKITDYYKGKQIPQDYIGLTISCLYRCQDRTLTEAEISPLQAQILAMLEENFKAKLR